MTTSILNKAVKMPPASDTPGSDQPDNSDGRRQPWKSFFSGEESGSEAESTDDQLVIGDPRPPDGTCAKCGCDPCRCMATFIST
ncbi:hypothetical protein H9L39_02385 [Fusarium oxysporum f. sp. albedinis]|nr:hypothetical protein H9L39_02385 [Fusarium oxysporum f. sp. albedinis]